MKTKILLVDDEPGILSSLERLLRRDKYEVLKAEGGAKGIAAIEANPDLAVIICDMRMPDVPGDEVLARARELVPGAVRIALTGYADTGTIVNCINNARISRFLMKPWEDEALREVVREAESAFIMKSENARLEEKVYEQNLELQELNSGLEKAVKERTAELEEARHALQGSMNAVLGLLAGVLETHSPGLRGHSRRVADMCRHLAVSDGCGEEEAQQIWAAGLLHDIGKIGLPSRLLDKNQKDLTPEERERYRQHAVTGYEMLKDLPGFDAIAAMIRHHHELFSGGGYPDGLAGDLIPKGSRIIAIATVYDRHRYPPGDAVIGDRKAAENVLGMAAGSKLDPRLLEVFLKSGVPSYTEQGEHEVEVSPDRLRPGMVLSRNVQNGIGKVMLREKTVLDDLIIDHLLHNSGYDPVMSRIFVLKSSIPEAAAEGSGAPAPAAAAGGVKPGEAEHAKPLVVVVDDEQHVLNALRRELSGGGYAVETFTNPVDALQQIRLEKAVYALITDMNMPGVRGDRFLAQVQKEFPELPCIVVTGMATKDTVMMLRKSVKIVRMLPKPWDKDALFATLAGLKTEQAGKA